MSAVLCCQHYLPERRSKSEIFTGTALAVFRHHYSRDININDLDKCISYRSAPNSVDFCVGMSAGDDDNYDDAVVKRWSGDGHWRRQCFLRDRLDGNRCVATCSRQHAGRVHRPRCRRRFCPSRQVPASTTSPPHPPSTSPLQRQVTAADRLGQRVVLRRLRIQRRWLRQCVRRQWAQRRRSGGCNDRVFFAVFADPLSAADTIRRVHCYWRWWCRRPEMACRRHERSVLWRPSWQRVGCRYWTPVG